MDSDGAMGADRREGAQRPQPVVNALTVDLEDWYQVSNFDTYIGREAWERCPEMRLCQLVVNAAGTNDPFYVEDIPLADALDEYPPETRQ